MASSSEIVSFKNRQSGMVLDHYAGKRIEAYNADTRNSHHQWRRIACASGCFAYKNVSTGCLLGHYPDEPLCARDRDTSIANCQWTELSVEGSGSFVALQNRATGMVLDHYREQSIQAYNSESDSLSQHWKLMFRNPTRPQCEALACAAVALDAYDVVAFKNRGTGKIVDHYGGERIEAYTAQVTHKNHQWHRIPMGDGCFAYKNMYTGKVLEHHYGESVQAFTAMTHLPSHQWKEVALADGFVALQNRASGKFLHHCHEKSIQACDDDVYSVPTLQWELVWVRRAL